MTGVEPWRVGVNAARLGVEHSPQFGGPWLAQHMIRRRQRDKSLEPTLPKGKESFPWPPTSLGLVIARPLDPSSERDVSEQWSPKTALPERPGVPAPVVDDKRVYRALDQLLPQKWAMVGHGT